MMRVAIVTVSDTAARGERADDTSGDAVAQWVAERGAVVASRATVADESVEIVRALLAACDGGACDGGACDGGACDVVFTTGGTGLSPRDMTPEATRAVLDREAPGIVELLRASVIASFPRAALSRGVAGVRGRTLVVNLPGSPGGVRDGLRALEPIIDHACGVVRGGGGGHGDA